jgi:hypothetical protein
LTASSPDSGWGAVAGVIAAVGLLSATALTGLVVDAISNFTVRRFLRGWVAKVETRAEFFLCRGEHRNVVRWRKLLTNTLRSSRYQHLGDDGDTDDIAVGVFFRTAAKEQVEWIVQHHAMYNLAAGFIVILIASSLAMLLRGDLAGAAFGVVGSYLLAAFSLEIYLYTYFFMLRSACLELEGGEDRTASTRSKSQPIEAPPHSGLPQGPLVGPGPGTSAGKT